MCTSGTAEPTAAARRLSPVIYLPPRCTSSLGSAPTDSTSSRKYGRMDVASGRPTPGFGAIRPPVFDRPSRSRPGARPVQGPTRWRRKRSTTCAMPRPVASGCRWTWKRRRTHECRLFASSSCNLVCELREPSDRMVRIARRGPLGSWPGRGAIASEAVDSHNSQYRENGHQQN
jgi:hypothetical protein